MNDLLYKLAEIFQLETAPTYLDLGVVVLIVILATLFVSNLISSEEGEKSLKTPAKKEIEQVAIKETKQVLEKKLEQVVVAEEIAPVPEPEKVEAKKEVISWNQRLFKGLAKTRSEIWGRIGGILGSQNLDEAAIEELEEILFTSDLSPVLVDELIEHLKTFKKEEGDDHLSKIRVFLKSKMNSSQEKVNTELYKFEKTKSSEPKVIMIVGVNGAGKTTTIGKLATKLRGQGASVVVGACDTFRAAAVEQLEVWCKRADVEIVKAGEGADPSGVAFDAVKRAKEIAADYCIIDTAGRLHNKSNLMDELAKTKKVMSKVVATAPHETLLVLDAITGQNALRQAEEFNKYLSLTGLIFTKCDGSSKAGSAVSIVQSLNVPIVYIGVGEDVEDLDIFNLDDFLNALLGISA